jgi:hypothetical protein
MVRLMARPARRHCGDKRADAEWWERWQFAATIIRIVIEVIDLFDHGGSGPGCLL